MLLVRYNHSFYNHFVPPASLTHDPSPALPAAFVAHHSLLPSDRVSSPLLEVMGMDLKNSGLPPSAPCSAIQNLAYLPCRIRGDSSTNLFFSGGGVAKKFFMARNAPKPGLPTALLVGLCPPPSFHTKERFDAI